MALPRFGFIWTEASACLALVMVGLISLVLSLTGDASELGAQFQLHLLPTWLHLFNSNRVWLSIQSVLVMAGGIGAWRCTSFILAIVGVMAALLIVTPIGVLTFVPGLLMLFLLAPRWRAFFPNRYGMFISAGELEVFDKLFRKDDS
jgi:uncharacterized membrane protein YkgB